MRSAYDSLPQDINSVIDRICLALNAANYFPVQDEEIKQHYETEEEFRIWYKASHMIYKQKQQNALKLKIKELQPEPQLTQLVTISFDKDSFKPEYIEAFVNNLRRNPPKVLDADEAICRPEFNAASSFDPSFNPHIHIYTPKVTKRSLIEQALRRKYIIAKNRQFPIYNVNVIEREYPIHHNYILGIKQDDKQDKMEKDKQYREANKLQETYYLKQF